MTYYVSSETLNLIKPKPISMSFLRPVNIVMILTGLKVDMEIIHSASSVEKTPSVPTMHSVSSEHRRWNRVGRGPHRFLTVWAAHVFGPHGIFQLVQRLESRLQPI